MSFETHAITADASDAGEKILNGIESVWQSFARTLLARAALRSANLLLFVLALVEGILILGSYVAFHASSSFVWRDQCTLLVAVLMTGLSLWLPSVLLCRPDSAGAHALLSAVSGATGAGACLLVMQCEIAGVPLAWSMPRDGHVLGLLAMVWSSAWSIPGLLLYRCERVE